MKDFGVDAEISGNRSTGTLNLVEGSYKYLYVNAKREAVVQLAVFGENQQRQGVRAII